MLNLQRIQNKNVKFAVKNDPRYQDMTIEDLQLQLEPINIRLTNRLVKLWNKIEHKEHDIYARSMDANRDIFKDHHWWPCAALKYIEDFPNPIYT